MSHGELFGVAKDRIPTAGEKSALYAQCRESLAAMLEGENETLVILSSIVAVLHQSMPHYFWTGFYRVVDGELCVGPYQGTPACLRIARGRGVCGTAWAEGRAIVVADVNEFPGHIACDARSVSEIVIPWKNRDGNVIAILDVDSTLRGAFDEVDLEALSALADAFAVPRANAHT